MTQNTPKKERRKYWVGWLEEDALDFWCRRMLVRGIMESWNHGAWYIENMTKAVSTCDGSFFSVLIPLDSWFLTFLAISTVAIFGPRKQSNWKESINQLFCQSIIQLIYQSINWTIVLSIYFSINQSTYQSNNQTTIEWINHSINQSINKSINQSII